MSDAPSGVPIEIRGLTRRFRTKVALDNVSLSVPQGCVFGLVGENGAGKTTLIKHVMGLLKAQSGSVGVFGVDPVKDPEGALSQIGYLSEDRDMPGWMRVEEIMRYTEGFYPNWDRGFADGLCRTFELDPSQRIKTLSMGQTVKTGLLIALADRPKLLVLDEPSSGLDPLVRQHILGAVMRTIADEGRTVLFSSHLLDEVERVCDRVAIISGGRIVLCDSLDTVRKDHYRFALVFEESLSHTPAIEGALSCEGNGKEWVVVAAGDLQMVKSNIQSLNARIVEEAPATMEEIFVGHMDIQHLGQSEKN